MLLDATASQLVLVDYQTRLMPAIHEGPAVLRNALRLAQAARLLRVPLVGTEENPEGLGPLQPELKALCGKVLPKMHFSAVQEGLLELLQPTESQPQLRGNARSLPKHLQKNIAPAASARESIVVAGCEAHVCLLQTALELLDEELEVWVVTDACGSRSERSRDAAFDRLAGAGAELVTTEMVVFEWLRTADHPQFKAGLDLVK